MSFFSRRDRIVDLTEDYQYERKRSKDALKNKNVEPVSAPSQESSGGGFFNFFGDTNTLKASEQSNVSSSSEFKSSENPDQNESLDAYEKRRRLAKRLKDMTDRIEDMSNQIYLLQQRIELLEKKVRVGGSFLED